IFVRAFAVWTAESTHISCTEDAMAEQSQLRDGLETTSGYRSLDCNHASHMCGNNMRRSSRAKAPTRRKILSPAGHIREYSCVLPIGSGSAPKVRHKRMLECLCCRGAACRDCRLEHFTIPL